MCMCIYSICLLLVFLPEKDKHLCEVHQSEKAKEKKDMVLEAYLL